MGDGTVKVGDFGSCRSVAKVASRHGDNEPCQYNYASPERWAGGDYGQKTDVYSLGAMLFEMCHPVFETAKERVDALRNLREERLPPNWTLPETHPSVAQLVLSMLALEPDRRPSASQAAIEAERLSTEQMASADSGHRGWSRLIGLVTQIFLCCVKTSSHKR
jgi:serine/threonine protein kinase